MLFTASKLHVFDVLRSSKTGELQAEDVAQEIKASMKGTERLLEACVSLGLLQRTGKGILSQFLTLSSSIICFLLLDIFFLFS